MWWHDEKVQEDRPPNKPSMLWSEQKGTMKSKISWNRHDKWKDREPVLYYLSSSISFWSILSHQEEKTAEGLSRILLDFTIGLSMGTKSLLGRDTTVQQSQSWKGQKVEALALLIASYFLY